MNARRPIILGVLALTLLAAGMAGGVAYLLDSTQQFVVIAAAVAAVTGALHLCWLLVLGGKTVRELVDGGRISAESINPFEGLVGAARFELDRQRQQLQQAEAQLDTLRARLLTQRRGLDRVTAALDSIAVPILLTDNLGVLLSANTAAHRIGRQITPEDSESELRLADFPGLSELVEDAVGRQAATDRCQAEYDWSLDGETYTFEAEIFCVQHEDRAVGHVIQLHNRTDDKRERSRHAEFVSSVSHEFKTPLACVRAYTEMLQDGLFESDEERVEACETIQNQVERLTRLVNNLLNLSRIESGVIDVKRDDCTLQDVLLPALSTIETSAEEKQITLTNSLSELYLPVHVDRDLFGQAILNLLSNAVKYTPSGGLVDLKCRQDERTAVIEVRDTGMGIPPDSLPKLFDRFYRVPENNKAAAGTGLGLTLVHYVVTELHSGKVDVQSTVGEGTTFIVEIPLGHQNTNQSSAKSQPAAGGNQERAPKSTAAATSEVPS